MLWGQLCPTLQPHGLSLLGFSAHGIFQARILEWVAILTPGDLPNPGIRVFCIGRQILYHCAA